MKKLIAVLLSTLMLLSLFTGCQKKEKAAEVDSKGKKPLKVALLVTGSVNDMGWNQAAYEGLMLVKKQFGAETAYTEKLAAADIEAALTDYASNGYDVVIGHGFQFGDPSIAVGQKFPDTKFICIESEAAAKNVASYVMRCEEGGYIMGMLAASMSKSNKVGFVGPIQGASLVKIMNGFEDGAKSIKSNINVQKAWTGSFTDTALAKESAKAMIESGVDVIGHSANESGTGAINAAKEAGIYATGDSYDQNSLAPNAILSSSIYNVPKLIETAVKDITDGKFEGKVKQLGLAEGIVEIAPYHELDAKISAEVKTLIDAKINEIKTGKFKVPCDTKVRS